MMRQRILLIGLALLVWPLLPARAQTEVDVHLQPPVESVLDEAQTAEFNKAVFFGKKFYDIGDLSSAQTEFQKANELFPGHPAVLYDMAVIFARQQNFAAAQEKIDDYRRLHPEGQEMPMISRLQLELDFQRELEKKRQADHDYEELFNRGRFLFDKSQYREALDVFRQAEQKRSQDPAVYYNEALTHEALGEYIKATDRLRRYLAVARNSADKEAIDRKIFTLESEVEDQRTKMICPFCGNKLSPGMTWCNRCWRGPYLPDSAIWNSRICGSGATAVRSTWYTDGRLNQNEDLPCLIQGASFRDTLKYSRAKQNAIEDARRSEGWTYDGNILTSLKSDDKDQIILIQGDGSLERMLAPASGEVLDYHGHQTSDGRWILDSEEYVIDGQRYHKQYAFGTDDRLARETVRYHNINGCGHLDTITADYRYQGDQLDTVTFHGFYTGFKEEGEPKADWKATLSFIRDATTGLVSKEELVVDSWEKTYTQRPPRDRWNEIRRMHPEVRVGRSLDLLRRGDYCMLTGTHLISNQIDLRPFFTISPNIAVLLPTGVTRMTTTFTYPPGFRIPNAPTPTPNP